MKSKMTQKERVRYRQTKKWKEFRAFMIDKADRRCSVCNGFKRKGLQIHHINPSAYGNEEEKDVIVSCPACHKELERILRKKVFDIDEYQEHMRRLYLLGLEYAD